MPTTCLVWAEKLYLSSLLNESHKVNDDHKKNVNEYLLWHDANCEIRKTDISDQIDDMNSDIRLSLVVSVINNLKICSITFKTYLSE